MSGNHMVCVGDDAAARDLGTLERTLARVHGLFERLWAPRVEGAHHLAAKGPALVVGNHSGGVLAMFEPLMLAHALAPHVGLAALPRLLLHEIMWRTPLAPAIARLGAVRASRSNADAVLARGEKVLVYPGGDREAFRSFFDRDRVCFGDRRGYVALAIAHGVPLVPVVTAGMHSGFVCLDDGHAIASRFPLARALRVGVLPLTLGFPFGLMPLVPLPYVPLASGVRIRVLAPISFSRSGAEAASDEAYVEACHARVVHAMQQALDALSLARRTERRSRLHAFVDRALDALERLTRHAPIALPTPITEPALAPIATPTPIAEVLPLPARTSRPSLPRAA